MNNQLTLKNIASKIWQETSGWFSSGYLNEDSFVTRLRYFQITAFCIFFVTSFLNFLADLASSYAITAIACVGLIAVRFLIDSNRIKAAYILLLCTVYLSLVLLTCAEGLRSGMFLFFFPSIISFSFLADFTNKRNVGLTFLLGTGSFLLAVLFAPDDMKQLTTENSLTRGNFLLNIMLSFFLIVWMSYSLARENNRKQTVLRNKEVFLNTIFNSSLHTEIIVDIENGLISNCNNHAASLFAANDSGGLQNKQACELFLELKGESGLELMHEICNPERNWAGELTCCRMDGTVFPGSVAVVSFRYNEKWYKKITIVDIAEKNAILSELQAAKQKAEELAHIKSQFLSHMSHELRTPLNGIIGSANLLLQDKFLPEQKDQLSILKFSSEHMLSLINDILDLSKLEAQKIQLEKAVIDIPKFIQNVSSSFVKQAEEKEVVFEVNVDPDLKRSVLADPTRLNQVLTNLLSNALKFTSKGSVVLEVKAISINSDTNTIQFSVKDTGIGIAEDKKQQIFEQFTQADVKTTRKYGGTGLGLTISQKLVRLMGGNMEVESKYHKGSRFYFEITLPVHNSRKKAIISEPGSVTDDQKLKGYKVLIAEDNPVNMIIASKFLDKWGVSYQKAKNGLEAVSLFGQNNFDMVLMDLEMPEMDGYGALAAIRKINGDIPAIAFTAAVFDNMKESLLQSGFNDYIQKPFRPQDLQSKLVAFYEALVKTA